MATTLLKLITILFLLLLIFLHPQNAFSTSDIEDEDEDDRYIIDSPFASTHRLRSRFLASVKKGTHCDPNQNSVCNGVSANNGTRILQCCKRHCRDVLGDRNNCGQCGKKCGFQEHCCGGTCINTANSSSNCGKCGHECSSGSRCHSRVCGYA